MSTFTAALLPIITIIILGYLLKRSHFLPENTWSGIEKLSYYVLFPALLVRTLGSQSINGVPWPSILLVLSSVLLFAALALVIWYRIQSSINGATFTSIFQGGIRFNTYIALAVSQAYFGAEGLALAAVTAGFMIILINLLCISAFVLWGEKNHKNGTSFLREVFGNPLIISCGIGWFLSLSNIGMPTALDNILRIMGNAALPLGLLAVGAALKPKAIHGHLKAILLASFVQFGLKPFSVLLLITTLGLTGIPASVLIIFFMTPTAPAAYILARHLGGDTETMSSIITFQTILAFLIMPIIAALMLP
ncbi:MAG: Auxin Efflux Carrier [uncultured Thiotrichaceae bacterium]|uniref:Auxin Efflux Carrier n=1 Tax=uncultured Thiotrichaceae bacterium TaxID=298394 RepID=A0A6S6T0R4_9GAMM|nr:MAG: Auxin Efflux Carrier [uncultured Thiotrichaceae bacterium]